MIVSPEIITSPTFCAALLSKSNFTSHLCTVCIDEAHCVGLWGGSFQKDYGELGFLHGALPPHVTLAIASATFPEHILDDLCGNLYLSKDAHAVALSNDRPNVALSCRTMQHPTESIADLHFLILENASIIEDIPVTLTYCKNKGLLNKHMTVYVAG